MTRREAREQAFLLLFDQSFHPELELDEIISLAAEENIIELDDFSKNIVQSVCAAMPQVDAAIEDNLRGWKMNRISRVSLAILRLAIGELLFTDAPAGVVVNEAVELSKSYSSAEDASFINGTLRSYLRKKEAE